MLQTTNYQLNQWEKSDRILMEDFNRDNEKLDSALQAIQDGCLVKGLVNVTTEQDANQVDVNLSGIDLTVYQELWVYIRYNEATEAAYIKIRLNGLDSGYTNGSNTYDYLNLISLNTSIGLVKITPLLGRHISGQYLSSVSPGELTIISFLGVTKTSLTTPALLAGAQIQILGVKR